MIYCKIFNESLSQYLYNLWINCVTAFAFNINWELIYFWILNMNVFDAISTAISICQFFILWHNFFFSFLKWWSAVCTRLFVNLTWRHRSTTPVTTDVPPTSSTLSTTSKPRGKYYWGGGGVLLGGEGRSGFSQFRVLHSFGISYTYTPKLL